MRVLTGHTKDVRAVAFAPDGRLVSGAADNTVRVWDPQSGDVLHTIRAGRPVYAVAVAPDGRTLAYGGRAPKADGTATVPRWDLPGGRPLDPLAWPAGPGSTSVWALAFSADGACLAAVVRCLGAANILNGAGGYLWRFDAPGGGRLPVRGYAARFAPAGRRLAVTGQREVIVFDGLDEQPARYPLSCDWSADVAFAAADTLVFAAGSFLGFADLAGGVLSGRVKTGLRAVTGVAVTPDGRTVVVGGKPGDATVEVYDAPARQRRGAFDFGVGPVHAVAVSPDGCTVAAAAAGGLVVWDLG